MPEVTEQKPVSEMTPLERGRKSSALAKQLLEAEDADMAQLIFDDADPLLVNEKVRLALKAKQSPPVEEPKQTVPAFDGRIEAPLIGTKSLAQAQIAQQADEGLKFADDTDDLRMVPGLPPGFPTHIPWVNPKTQAVEDTEIKPYFALYKNPDTGEDEFGGHPLKKWLCPVTYSFCQSVKKLNHLPRSAFNGAGEFQFYNSILCVVPMQTWEKIKDQNPGTTELMRRRLEAERIKGSAPNEIKTVKTQDTNENGQYTEGELISTLTIGRQVNQETAIKGMVAASGRKAA